MTYDRIKAGDKLFTILNALLNLEAAGVRELASELDMPKSTVHQHLKTLEHNAYAVKTDDGYQPSLKFLNTGARIRARIPVYQASKSEVRELATNTGSHAGLTVEENGRGVLLKSSRSPDASALPFDEFAGIRMALHTTASGKVTLANMNARRMDEIIDQHGLQQLTCKTITDRETLEEELETIRENGFAVSSEEGIEGLRSVAAPITDMSGKTHGAITVYGPSGAVEEEFVEETSQYVVQASKVCEMNLNHNLSY